MTIVTRFAPSPTGYLHIGGARTALFNWLFARHHGGRFLLRIEDTDRARSTPEAVTAILDSLAWLGLDWDGDAVYQSHRADDHAAAAGRLLAEGKAYRCYCTPDELREMREHARAEGRTALYDGRWRDRDPADAPPGIDPVIRLKAPRDGETVIDDLVQGTVRVANDRLDDMVLLRGDGTPTYMLSVVVDDHDMAVSHVIRGDDHLTNAFRQTLLYGALGWDAPAFAHIPLIHGPDGAKLSKRHGALGVEAYREMGYLPAALRNYLLRLGWSHGDAEVISTDQAIAWFDLDAVGKSAARLDLAKLDHLNGLYIRETPNAELMALLGPLIETRLGGTPAATALSRVQAGLAGLKARAKTLPELADGAMIYIRERPLAYDAKAAKLLAADAVALLHRLADALEVLDTWDEPSLEAAIRAFAESEAIKMGKIAQPLRAALTGTTVSPGIFEVIAVFGRTETLIRLREIQES